MGLGSTGNGWLFAEVYGVILSCVLWVYLQCFSFLNLGIVVGLWYVRMGLLGVCSFV